MRDDGDGDGNGDDEDDDDDGDAVFKKRESVDRASGLWVGKLEEREWEGAWKWEWDWDWDIGAHNSNECGDVTGYSCAEKTKFYVHRL